MRHISMAIPALSVSSGHTGKIMILITVGNDIIDQGGMTGSTVGLHPIGAIFTYFNVLSEGVQGKGNGVIPAVTRLGGVFINHTVNRQMTFNAAGTLGVGAVLPCRIVGIHDMTIDAGLRVG